MKTPWADSKALAGLRLHPGPQATGRQASERHQRRRIFAGLVAAVDGQGYSHAIERRLAQQSGVARSALHKLSPSGTEECFLTAVDILYEDALAKMWAVYRAERDPHRGLRAALCTVAQTAIYQPEASRMALVHVYEVGPAGAGRAQRAAGQLAALIEHCLAARPGAAQCPPALSAAIAGAIPMLFHDRLRRGRERQPPVICGQLAEWALSYHSSPMPIARSRARARTAQHPPEADPRVRLLYTIARLCAERGYRNVAVDALVRQAKTSLRVLYDRYGGKQACFLACFEMTRKRTLRAALSAPATAAAPGGRLDPQPAPHHR